jgi:hypothetical protein
MIGKTSGMAAIGVPDICPPHTPCFALHWKERIEMYDT